MKGYLLKNMELVEFFFVIYTYLSPMPSILHLIRIVMWVIKDISRLKLSVVFTKKINANAQTIIRISAGRCMKLSSRM